MENGTLVVFSMGKEKEVSLLQPLTLSLDIPITCRCKTHPNTNFTDT